MVTEARRPMRHGTRSGYNSGCSCPECRDAEAEYQRERRERLQARREDGGMPLRSHGLYGYVGWRCRCGQCRTAMREARVAWKRGVAANKAARS